MKKYFLLAVFISFFSIACRTKNDVIIPADVLPRAKMVRVLVKINLLEACINLNAMNDGKISTNSAYFDPLKEEKITPDQYNKSFDFYSHHPALMDSIYDDVLNELSKQKAEEIKR